MDRGSYHSIGGGDQNNLKTKKDMQEFKVVVCEEFTNSCGKKIKGKERMYQLNVEFQRIAKTDTKAFLSEQCKETEEIYRMGKRLEISSRKLDIPREHFMQRWAQ